MLKWILSVSLGSSLRDHSVETEIMGQSFKIERRGTDGDMKKAIEIITVHDGQVDAFGMGGIDIYLGGSKQYIIKDALPILQAAQRSPMVDGTGLKNTLERRIIKYIDHNNICPIKGKKVMMTCGIDRFGMAEAFEELGADVMYGDVTFGLGIPYVIKSKNTLEKIAKVLMPIVCRLPFAMLYPTGKKQEKITTKYDDFYLNSDIIAGDFHYIKKYLPLNIEGKTIITNTVTQDDVEMLKARGASMLITSTPNLEGRSFATNVMEAVLISLSDKHYEDLTDTDYEELLDKMNMKPRIECFKYKDVAIPK
jgi:hypothetical protein